MSKQANVPPLVPICPSPASFPKASHTGHCLSLVSPACCYRASMVCLKIAKSGDQLVLGTQEMERKQSLRKMRGYTETQKKLELTASLSPSCLFMGAMSIYSRETTPMRLQRREMWRRLRNKVCFSKIERCVVTTQQSFRSSHDTKRKIKKVVITE